MVRLRIAFGKIEKTFEKCFKQVVIIEVYQAAGLTFKNNIDMLVINRVDLKLQIHSTRFYFFNRWLLG